jgi:ElaB/YqjD/DUF883 family membrane-anchored ribosome-binding protein
VAMSRNAESAAEELTADLAAMRKEVARLVDVVGEFVRDRSDTAGTRVATVLDDARDRIASTADDARGRVRAVSGDLVDTVERHPVAALLIAFGIGMSLGLMGRRGR